MSRVERYCAAWARARFLVSLGGIVLMKAAALEVSVPTQLVSASATALARAGLSEMDCAQVSAPCGSVSAQPRAVTRIASSRPGPACNARAAVAAVAGA